jgi:hypothetical protein
MNRLLQESIKNQRRMIGILLENSLTRLARTCENILLDNEKLSIALLDAFPSLPYCKYLYATDPNGIQISANASQDGLDRSQIGRDRSERPYIQGIFDGPDFHLSEAYISLSERRPSLTAIHVIRDAEGSPIAVLGADYDLRELPHTESLYKETDEWRQLKGDPAIRGSLFHQQRVQSRMDLHFAEVLSLLQELMEEHGVFHGKLHFSSSRATVWQADNPYVYHLLDYEELTDPDTCLAFPKRPYFEQALVPRSAIPEIFERFRMLRFADETVYLRSGSLNIVNGVVGLNFSCDGTHYMQHDDFLGRDENFWFGGLSAPPAACATQSTDHVDEIVETICDTGCTSVTDIIARLDSAQPIDQTRDLSSEQQAAVLAELKSIMAVYNEHSTHEPR